MCMAGSQARRDDGGCSADAMKTNLAACIAFLAATAIAQSLRAAPPEMYAKGCLSNALSDAGIPCREVSYYDDTGQYCFDFQFTQLHDLFPLAEFLRRIDLTSPPSSDDVRFTVKWDTFRYLAPDGPSPYPLNLFPTQVTNLTLRYITHDGPCTIALNLCHTQVTTLAALRGLPVTLLWLDDTPLRDLSSLAGLPIKSLMIDREVSNVTPICDLPVEELFINWIAVTNGLSCLRQSRSLKTINREPVAWFWKRFDEYQRTKHVAEQGAAPLPRDPHARHSDGGH